MYTNINTFFFLLILQIDKEDFLKAFNANFFYRIGLKANDYLASDHI